MLSETESENALQVVIDWGAHKPEAIDAIRAHDREQRAEIESAWAMVNPNVRDSGMSLADVIRHGHEMLDEKTRQHAEALAEIERLRGQVAEHIKIGDFLRAEMEPCDVHHGARRACGQCLSSLRDLTRVRDARKEPPPPDEERVWLVWYGAWNKAWVDPGRWRWCADWAIPDTRSFDESPFYLPLPPAPEEKP